MKRVILFVVAVMVLGLSRAYAITPLDVGYYAYSNAAIVYTGSWATGSVPAAYGGSLTYTSTNGDKLTFYTLPTVGHVGIYYAALAITGTMAVSVNGVNVANISTTNAANLYNVLADIPLPAGNNKVEISLSSISTYLEIIAIQLFPVAPSSVAVTVVVNLPTHTPTPTYTPTPTNTPGPSPTRTPTPSPTPNYGLRVTQVLGDQSYDVALKMEVTPADFAQVGFLVVITGLLITLIFVYVHRSQQ